MITPNGRYLGRKPSRPDPNDLHFFEHHVAAMAIPIPPNFDLEPKLPPAFDQQALGSCTANAGCGMAAALWPGQVFSRLGLYYDTRMLEGTIDTDAGGMGRDVCKVMQKLGLMPEVDWPYDISKFTISPPAEADEDALKHRIKSYTRLVSALEMYACLASGFPFMLGITLFESFDSPELETTGVYPLPDPDNEQEIGGHEMLAVGYDRNFHQSKALQDSGYTADEVPNEMIKIRNSWGPKWGLNGYLWMPVNYLTNGSTGGDNFTCRC